MLAAGLGLCVLGYAQALLAQPAELLAVEKWRLSYTYNAQGSGKTAEGKWFYQESASGNALLVRRQAPDQEDYWEAERSDTTVSVRATGTEFGDCEFNDTIDYAGPARAEDRKEAIYVLPDGLRLDMGNRAVDARVTTEMHCKTGGHREKRDFVSPATWDTIWTELIPYPAEGLVMTGTLRGDKNPPAISGAHSAANQVSSLIHYTLTPEGMQHLRLEITPSMQYADWRPTAAADGGDGEPVEFTATLRTADAGVPEPRIERFEWELVETSAEPGITINWPRQPDAGAPDLYFREAPAATAGVVRNPEGDKGQKVIVAYTDGGTLSDSISVHPRDWGGWSTLRVVAVLDDGREFSGRLAGAAEDGVRLPDRDPGRFIARAWLEQRGISDADRSDLDDQPKGDSHPGDGLTLYEEYRGFHVDGRRVEGDPERKELFVVNEGGAPGAGGVQLFRRLTGLRVHGQLRKDEMDDKRVVNHNASASPRLGPQHAVWIKVEEKRKGAAEAVNASGRPSTPGGVEYIGLPVELPWRATTSPSVSYESITVAHELLHAVNVYHHGESDQVVFWSRDPDGKMYEQATVERKEEYVPVGPRSEIRAFLEDGRDVTHQTRVGLRHLGTQHGQHSGAENCVMRYDIADSNVSIANPTHRYVGIKEIQGAGLDNTPEGSDVNLLARLPQSRYGSAAQGRGACQAQILVSDAIKPPAR
jgi:hypothetical protein